MAPDLEKLGASIKEGSVHGRTHWSLSIPRTVCFDNQRGEGSDGSLLQPDKDARRQMHQSLARPVCLDADDPYTALLWEVASFAPWLHEVGVVTVIEAGMISLAFDPAAR